MFRPRSIGLLLALATLLVFLPATSNHFINYDDPQYVTENPFVSQGLSWTGFKWAFAGAHASNWHPLTWLSHMLDCDLFHLNPAGPHLVNILFHALNAALLFALLLRLTGRPDQTSGQPDKNLWPCAFAAALFAWHPLHVESVAWVAERKDMLSTFFALLTLLSYTRYAQKKSGIMAIDVAANARSWVFDYWLALSFFALALLSKAMPVTLPLVMLLLDFWPLKRLATGPGQWRAAWRLALEKIPFLALSGMVCVITVLSQHHAESSLSNVPLGLRLENVVTAYAGYLGKMIWPLHLAVFYPMPATISRTWLVESALILAGISVLAWRERKTSPWLLVGWLWFLGTLVPVIGLVQVGSQSMADRYSYFPAIGIFLATAFSFAALTEHFSFLKKWLGAAAILMLVACVFFTEKQLSYWHASESLFRHALEVEDSDIAHISLGGALRDQNRPEEALTQYIMAWRINPESVLPNANIAGILAEQDKPALAAVYYQRAVQHNTWLPSAYENYGCVLMTLKRYDEAMKQFAAAEKIEPTEARPHFLMGQLWLKQGRDAEAVKQYQAGLKLDPDNLEMLVLTASILASSENPQARNGVEARTLAERAVKLTQSQQAAALDVLAMSYAENGKFGEAVLVEQQAIKLAEASGQQDGVALLQQRLQKYQARQPWRESFKSEDQAATSEASKPDTKAH